MRRKLRWLKPCHLRPLFEDRVNGLGSSVCLHTVLRARFPETRFLLDLSDFDHANKASTGRTVR